MTRFLPVGAVLIGLFLIREFVRGASLGKSATEALALVALVTVCRKSMSALLSLAVLITLAIQIAIAPSSLTRAAIAECGLMLIAGTAALALAQKRGHRVPRIAATPIVIALLAAIDAKFGPQHSIKAALPGVQIALILGLGIIGGVAITGREVDRFLRTLTAIAIAGTVIAVVESVSGHPFILLSRYQVNTHVGVVFRPSAFFGHPTVMAGFNTVVALAQLARQQIGGRWTTPLLSLGVGIPLVGAVLSQSRSMYVVLALGMLVIFAWRGSNTASSRTTAVLIVGTLSTIGFFLVATLDSGIVTRFDGLNATEQVTRRSAISNALEYTTGTARILGNGPRSIQYVFQSIVSDLQLGSLDNQFATMFADYGIIGLVVLALLATVLLRAVFLRRSRTEAAPLVVAAIGVLGLMLFLDALYWPVLAIPFAVGVGASLGTGPSRQRIGARSTSIKSS